MGFGFFIASTAKEEQARTCSEPESVPGPGWRRADCHTFGPSFTSRRPTPTWESRRRDTVSLVSATSSRPVSRGGENWPTVANLAARRQRMTPSSRMARDLATPVFGRQFQGGDGRVRRHESSPSPGERSADVQRVLPWVIYAVVRQLCAEVDIRCIASCENRLRRRR